jgi:transcriptional regulator with XRE-family HTH domain
MPRFDGYLSHFMRQRRLELNLRQKDVAEAIGSTADFVSLLEAGERRLDLDKVPLLADVLQAKCAWALWDRCPQLFLEIFAAESVAAPPEPVPTQAGAA